MTIYFFTRGGMESGSSRQRAILMAEELNKIGQPAVVFTPPKIFSSTEGLVNKAQKIIKFIESFLKIKKEDIIYLQRTTYNKKFLIWIVAYRFIFRRKIVFDFDDALYFQYPLSMKILTSMADAVIVGSHSLQDWALKYNKNVFLIPTSVNHLFYAKYGISKRSLNDKIIVGWIGNGRDHYKNLCMLKSVFEKLVDDGLDFKFRLIGAMGNERVYNLFKNISGLDVELVDSLDWSNYENMPKEIQFFDIGLMPLIDDEWHRGKCAYKAIEYMACAVPAVISPVGENNYLIEDGVSGYFASSADEWHTKLKELILDSGLRKMLGDNGQRVIEARYSFQVSAPKLLGVFKNVGLLITVFFVIQ